MRAPRRLTRRRLLVLVLLTAASAGVDSTAPAAAQVRPRVPTHRDVTAPALGVPVPVEQEKHDGELELPVPSPPPTAPAPSRTSALLEVRTFELSGNTAFSREELAALLARYEGRALSYEDLEELRYAVTRLYVDAGYISSGAVIPDQRVTNGVVRIDIVEGRLSSVEVTGQTHFSADYLRQWVLSLVTEPVNIGQLERSLQLVTRDRRIRRIRASLLPTGRLGESVLRLDVAEHSPLRASLGADNWTEPAVGEAGGRIEIAHDNLFGRAQQLVVYSDATEGVVNAGGRYSLPLPTVDLELEGFGEYSRNRIVMAPFSELDIESESHTYGAAVAWTLRETVASRHTLRFGADHTETLSSLLGIDFSFEPGAHDGKTSVTPVRLAYEALVRDADTAVAARLRLSQGTGLLGATENQGNRPDDNFTAVLVQVQALQTVGRLGSLVVRLDGQYSKKALFSCEQLAAGGHDTVRGYPESYVSGDKGVVASVEMQIPVLAEPSGRTRLEAHVFVDTASLELVGRAEPVPSTLVSVGAGLRWRPIDAVEAVVDFGVPLRADAADSGDAQDYGIHLGITTDLRPVELASFPLR